MGRCFSKYQEPVVEVCGPVNGPVNGSANGPAVIPSIEEKIGRLPHLPLCIPPYKGSAFSSYPLLRFFEIRREDGTICRLKLKNALVDNDTGWYTIVRNTIPPQTLHEILDHLLSLT